VGVVGREGLKLIWVSMRSHSGPEGGKKKREGTPLRRALSSPSVRTSKRKIGEECPRMESRGRLGKDTDDPPHPVSRKRSAKERTLRTETTSLIRGGTGSSAENGAAVKEEK